jgi:hypothetical protein
MWTIETVDSNPLGFDHGFGEITMALDSHNQPHISYIDYLNKSLKHAVRDLSGWRTEVVERTADVVQGASIAVDSLDHPWIAYQTVGPLYPRWDIKLAHWNGTDWLFQTVDRNGVGSPYGVSLALDSRDWPRIVYYLNPTGFYDLAYIVWDGTLWRHETILATGIHNSSLPQIGVSLKLDGRENPGVAYSGNGTLSYFNRDDGGWHGRVVDFHPDEGFWPSLAFDSHDFPHISYEGSVGGVGEDDLMYASWNGTDWVIETACSPLGAEVGAGSSLALDSRDIPHISFTHETEFFGHNQGHEIPNYTYYTNKAQGLWLDPVVPLDPTEFGYMTSLAIDSHDLPHVSYRVSLASNDTDELRYAYIPWVDSNPPVSQVLPISPYWNGGPVEALAADESGVANVALWFRFSADNSTWGPWTQFSTLDSPPWIWSFTFPGGEGYYEYYSTAIDTMGNIEPPPAIADAIEGHDVTPPVSASLPIFPYWQRFPSIIVTATATDSLSGVADVTLSSSYSQDNSTWSPWTQFQTKTSPPWQWSFQFMMGEGYYRFFTIAKDVAGNAEGAKTFPEAIAAYIIRAPVTSLWIGMPNCTDGTTFIKSTTPLTLSVIDRGGTGIAHTEYRPDNTTWTEYTGQFFLSGDGDHYVEWYSEDNAGNVEDVSRRVMRVDDTPPTTTISPASPFTLTATDSGCGVNVTMYRIDGGDWTVYTNGFTVPEGEHNISFYSVDNLNNTELERWLVVKPPPEVAVNCKPIVALIFAIILLVAGVWSSKKRPWKGGKDSMAVVKAFILTPMPFVAAEAATGVISFLTGGLSIPPVVGVGMAVDCAILILGLVVLVARAVKKKVGSE